MHEKSLIFVHMYENKFVFCIFELRIFFEIYRKSSIFNTKSISYNLILELNIKLNSQRKFFVF